MTDLTEGQRIYAVGDIHGRLDLLTEMLARIRADLAARPHPRPLMIFLGDYVDRGPDSRGVIETLIGLGQGDVSTAFLLGNHDRYVQAYLDDPDWYDLTFHWLADNLGGARTLASYGVEGADPLRPAATRDAFAAAFPASHGPSSTGRRSGSAAVGATSSPTPGSGRACRWRSRTPRTSSGIREPFLTSSEDFGFKVVHGHTIVKAVEHHPNRIAVGYRGLPHRGALLRGDRGRRRRPARAGGAEALAGGFGPRRVAEPVDTEVTWAPRRPLFACAGGGERISPAAHAGPRGVAQLVEHRALSKPRVVGSSPIAPASMPKGLEDAGGEIQGGRRGP